jgi:hypothetical protein
MPNSAYTPSTELRRAFGTVRILFGIVWLVNTYLQMNPAYSAHFLDSMSADWAAGQPSWLAAYGHWTVHWVTAVGAERVAGITIALDAFLAASLISGLGLPFLAWVGVLYNLWLWSTVGGLGGPYTAGATDPGTAIVYALAFLLVIWTRSWEGLSLARARPQAISLGHMRAARLLFGLLWAFDAFWKWQPYFLTHAVSYLQQAEPGEPAWIVAYIAFFIALIQLVGPMVFGVFAALAESLIALALLFGRGLRWMIPLGLAYSIGLWTTAEGWGGPYLPGATANKGDVLGTTNIYAIVFLFFAAWVYLGPSRSRVAAEERSATAADLGVPG